MKTPILVNNVPFSEEFGDFYYNVENGLEESRLVFLEGNNLPQAWRDSQKFIIAETGFGTGLNFLTTLHEWLKQPGGLLIYYSIEINLLSSDFLAEVYKNWPELEEESHMLLANNLPENVKLHILNGDVSEKIEEIPYEIDAWFLDGFSPKKNLAMWADDVLLKIGERTKPCGTVGSFTAAGFVRKGLQNAGFEVFREKGYGKKRHRIKAVKK